MNAPSAHTGASDHAAPARRASAIKAEDTSGVRWGIVQINVSKSK
jgi:hypothetical protein